jgi:heme a synthase
MAAVVVQYSLGVATLLLLVPVTVATAHQFGAIVLLTIMLIVLHHLPRREQLPDYANTPLAKESDEKGQ